MPVNSTHSEYDNHIDLWSKVRDCVRGQHAIKARSTVYLPMPDDSASRYRSYKERAVFLNVTGRTLNGLVGAAFRKNPEVELPEAVNYIANDADNSGNSLTQLARSVVWNVGAIGRHGLLVDYPEAPEGLSVAQVNALGLRPIIREYAAEDIINWREANGYLNLVVLKEMHDIDVDGFATETVTYYRVLSLSEGVYTQVLFNEDGEVVSETTPRKGNGSTWDVIPFVIAGAVNNDPCVDMPTLLDLADMNIAHYRASADYEEGVFLHGQPMLHIDVGDMATDVWQQLNPNGITVGARRGLVTNGGGSATLLQAASNTAAFESMQHKETQMVMIGGRLIQSGGANQTAEAVRANTAAEHSVLETIVRNTNEALELCLAWVCEFANTSPDFTLTLNSDFFDTPPDANMLAQMMGLESVGVISKEVILGYLRKTGVVDDSLTDEEILDAVDESGPMLSLVSNGAIAG